MFKEKSDKLVVFADKSTVVPTENIYRPSYISTIDFKPPSPPQTKKKNKKTN